jgi:uncharacterized protein YqgC (DUF456 family)
MTFFVNFILDVFLLLSLFSLVFALPGTWFMLGALILGVWGLPEHLPFSWNFVFLSFVLVAFAEVLEFVSGILGVKKTGGSRRASWGAMIGGFAGVLLGTPFLPPLGSFAGLFLGTFLGAYLMERDVNPEGSKKVAWGATLARFMGFLLKFLAGGAILALVFWRQAEIWLHF